MTPDPEWTVYIEEPRFVRAGRWEGRWRFHGCGGLFVAGRVRTGWIAGAEGDSTIGFGRTKRAAIAAWEAKVITHPAVDAIVWRPALEAAA